MTDCCQNVRTINMIDSAPIMTRRHAPRAQAVAQLITVATLLWLASC